MITVQRYDSITVLMQNIERTPQGGLRARARFTRSGVLDYELPDGTVRREWRPPEEVFAPESYRTLHDAPITINHPKSGEVDAASYRRETVGHVSSDIAPEANEFLAGTAVIQDESTVRMTLGGHLSEFSAGYLSLLEATPGTVPDGMPDAGKPYDFIQRRIRYNHMAYLPPGLGRAGPEVSIRLDSKGNQLGPITQDNNMELTPEELAALKGLAAMASKLQALVAAPAPASDPAPAAPMAPATAVVPREDVAPAAPAPSAPSNPMMEEKKNDGKGKTVQVQASDGPKPLTAAEQERLVNDSIELRDQARTVLGAEYNFRGKSNRDVMVDVVKHVDSKFELGERSHDYLRGRFESALEQAPLMRRMQEEQHLELRTVARADSKGGELVYEDDNDYLMSKIAG